MSTVQAEMSDILSAEITLEIPHDQDLTMYLTEQDVDAVDQQLIIIADRMRASCAERWDCPADEVRISVSRQHDLGRGWAGWKVKALWARAWAEDWALALPGAARAGLQAAQKKRAC